MGTAWAESDAQDRALRLPCCGDDKLFKCTQVEAQHFEGAAALFSVKLAEILSLLFLVL